MKILIIDDLTSNLVLAKKIMSKYGKCTTANSGTVGLREYQIALESNSPYDLICLDIFMTGLSGLEVLQKIRKIDTSPNRVKILMTTSAKEEGIVVKAIKLGCDDYLIKPYSRQKFEERMIRLNLYNPNVDDKNRIENKEKKKTKKNPL